MSIEAVAWAFKQTTGSVQSKMLLIHMCNAANEEHDYLCWHRIDVIVERTEMSRSTVKRHMKTLMDMGYITLVEKGGRVEGSDKTNKFRVNYLALKDKSTSSERTGKTTSTSSERTIQGVQTEPVKGFTLNPKKVNRKVKEKEEETSSSFFVDYLVLEFGYSEADVKEKYRAILDKWELESVTKQEFTESHEIAVKNKDGHKHPTLGYVDGIIFNRRKDLKPAQKKQTASRPQQTSSTDIEDNPVIKENLDAAHWKKLKSLGFDVGMHLNAEEVES